MKTLHIGSFCALLVLLMSVSDRLNAQELFQNVTSSAGINIFANRGIALGDYDADGFLDIYFCSNPGPSLLFHNNGDNTFTEVAGPAGVQISGVSASATWVDFDNDDDLDLFVSCYWEPNRLFKNVGGKFIDVAPNAGIVSEKYSSQGVWADFDKDGYVDLFLAIFEDVDANELYRNNGDGTFINVAVEAGVMGPSKSRTATWGDFDNDSWPDLLVSGQRGSVLYHNDRNSTFSDSSLICTEIGYRDGLGNAWADWNNDSFFDLTMASKYEPLALLINNGQVFLRGDSLFIPQVPDNIISVAWGDVDNDGFNDLYAKGFDEKEYLLKNSHGENLLDITDESGLRTGAIGCSAALGDLDSDGDLDLVVTRFDSVAVYFYENLLEDAKLNNHWLDVDLHGVVSNHSAIGARVILHSEGSIQVREKECGESCFVQNSPIIHFGLGNKLVVDSLIIQWPSGVVQKLTQISADQHLDVVEPVESKIFASIDTMRALQGSIIFLPVRIDLPAGHAISSAEIELTGFSGHLGSPEIVTQNSLAGDAEWIVESVYVDSAFTMAWAGAKDVVGQGILFWLKLAILDTTTGFFPVRFESLLFDSGEVPATWQNGGVNVMPLQVKYGDADMDGAIHAFDASLILKSLVGMISLDDLQRLNADVTIDNSISAYDASYILRYIVGLDSLPVTSPPSAPHASGKVGMKDSIAEAGNLVTVPIYLSEFSDIASFELCLLYEVAHLDFLGVTMSGFSSCLQIESREQDGVIRVAATGTQPLSGDEDEVMCMLDFRVKQNFSASETHIVLNSLRWNEEQIEEDVASARLVNTQSTTPNGKEQAPIDFFLFQNRPNPFNHTTIIEYSIAEGCEVTITIHSLNGQQIDTINQGTREPGSYSLIWDASRFASGVYLYKIQAGKYRATKKMLYLR